MHSGGIEPAEISDGWWKIRRIIMDIQILLLLQNFRETIGGCLNGFLAFVTTISVDYYIFIPALILFWVIDKKKGLYALASYGLASYVNAALKATFCVYRPWIRNPEIKPLESVMSGATGYSFPSGHSSSVGGFYGGLIAAYRKHKQLCVLFVAMILLTMFSRMYVGVHTPQDVLVGAAVGILAAVVVVMTDRFLEKYPNKDWCVLAIVVAMCALLLQYLYFKNYPMDYVDGELLVDPVKMTVGGFKDPGRFFGVVLGWFVEKRLVRFEIKGTTAKKVIMCFLGSLLFVFYWTAVMEPIGNAIGNGLAHFFLQASAPFLFMTVYPWAFSKRCN